MKPEKINQLIAEHCGFEKLNPHYWKKNGRIYGLVEEQEDHESCGGIGGGYVPAIPKYCNDLNAIAGAIKEVILGNADLERAFIKHLNAILDRRADDEAGPVICEYEMAQITADAEEFCEALLRTVGKWEEE